MDFILVFDNCLVFCQHGVIAIVMVIIPEITLAIVVVGVIVIVIVVLITALVVIIGHVHYSRACDRYVDCNCTVVAIIIFIGNLWLPT